MKILRIGVVASGFTGMQHIEALGRIPGTQVVALADTDRDALEKKAGQLNIPGVYTDYKQMIAEQDLDVLHNCTPNALHYEVNRYAMERGIHVNCEKPLATTLEQAEELTALARECRVAAGVNFNYRHNTMVQEMGVRIARGEPGRCFLIHGSYLQDWLAKDTDYNWRLDSSEGGESRAVADIGSHWFDTVQCILRKKITAVNANLFITHPVRKRAKVPTGTFVQQQAAEYEEVPIKSEDGGMIQVRFEDGTLGSLLISQVSAGHNNDLKVELNCAEYSMSWEQEQPDKLVVSSRDTGRIVIAASPWNVDSSIARYATLPAGHVTAWSDALRNGIREFYQSVRTGTFAQEGQTYATFADAGYIMRIVQACLDSNKNKIWIEV